VNDGGLASTGVVVVGPKVVSGKTDELADVESNKTKTSRRSYRR
jgi:hypothetical protein